MTLFVIQTVSIRVWISIQLPSLRVFTLSWSKFTLAAYFMVCEIRTIQLVFVAVDNAMSVTATFKFLDDVMSNLKAFPNAFSVTSVKVFGSFSFSLQ